MIVKHKNLRKWRQKRLGKSKLILFYPDQDPDPQQQILTESLDNLSGYGDSFTAGADATSAANRYINRVASALSVTLTNNGVGGFGARNVTSVISQHTVNQNTRLISCMVGLNTLSQISITPNQFGASALSEIEACYNHVFTRGVMSGAGVASGSANVVRSGSIAAYAANSNGGTFPTGTLPGDFATISSGTASWSWVDTFTQFTIAFIARSTHGTGSVYIDGVKAIDFDLKQWYTSTSVGSVSFHFWGLSNSSHTIEVVANGEAPVAVDYFAILKPPQDSASFLFADVPYCTPAGYAALSGGLANTTNSDMASARIKAINDGFRNRGYNIARVKINSYSDAQYTTDGIHRNDFGHQQLANGFLAATIL